MKTLALSTIALVSTLTACATMPEEPQTACTGKCDDPGELDAPDSTVDPFTRFTALRSFETDTVQTLVFRLELRRGDAVSHEDLAAVFPRQTLALDLRLADGDANPDFTISTLLHYGAHAPLEYSTDEVATNDFLPWRHMVARVSGTIESIDGSAREVDQEFDVLVEDIVELF